MKMMIYMKNYIRILVIMVALMWGTVSGAWAQLSASDVEIEVKPSTSAGTVTASVHEETREVTLTVTPASGYYIKASDIIVEKLVDPGKANAPIRRAAGVADVIKGKMYSGSGRTDADIISSVENSNSAQYVFTLPADYDGAYVTATFHLLTEGDIIRITASTNLGNSPDMTKHYILVEDVSATVVANFYSSTPFTGTFEGEAKEDGSFPTIAGLTHALFQTVDGNGTVKNIVLDNVGIGDNTTISGVNKTATGAIANIATGSSRIYNCGIQATNSTVKTDEDGYTHIDVCSSSVGANSDYVGGIVGFLDGTSRVVNCYSYANITSGTNVGGIVGWNNVATTATNLKTMVMNCMFYGEVSGSSIAPIYNGEIITNVGANIGVSNFNYFRLESSYIQNTGITKVYHCALGAETRFLQRFEFFRHLQNSHRELAAWWATGNYSDKEEMAKWVLLPSQIGSSTPYPVLKTPDYYPSVVNIDAKNATTQAERNKGGKMGTLAVTIQMGSGGKVFGAPEGAQIKIPYKTLNITDKDFDHFNFNYYKVQLPYYNDVGTGNYTGNRVVTGWKIVSITGGTPGTYTESDSWGGYNFADRNCTNKDLYSESERVFSQGAYWDVPEGVTAITIEPYWAKAAYLADANADKVYDTKMDNAYNVANVGGGTIYNNGNSYSIAGKSQKVYTSLSSAVSGLSITGTPTVNDYAVVLVGNYHHVVTNNGSVSGSSPYTVTSVDLDGDDEPDYSLMLRNNGRNPWHPVKWDFINIPGLGMAQKSTGATAVGSYNLGIVVPTNWFETTNTALFRVTQFEYERSQNHTTAAPYILQGGVMEQWVTGQQDTSPNNITYFHVGGNVWFKEFHRGVHQDRKAPSNHPPVSVTGGDYDEFYLTGLYRGDVASYADNAECYINGGRFGTVAGAAMEGIGKADGADDTGNITWQIQNADIKEFYGGGINAAQPVTGNISTTITGGKIDLFCGGPKFGDMSKGKTVTTTATGCEFGTFFGAGYGGSSYSRRAPQNITNMINMPATTKDNKSYDSWNAWVEAEYTQQSATNFPGISTRFDYQFIPNSGNADNVGRLFVEHILFSLATTRNVTSTLTNCTITGNFYGGGSLGKVDGPVTSTLTDCTIKGNVFGAGYSASLPTVEVDSIGFRVEPYYYTDLGTYRTGVKGKTTTYKWAHGNAIGINKNDSILYTTEDLDGLGAVTGNATLTINGTTTVGESVYGGGEESTVGGNTTVTVNSGRIGVENTGKFGYRWGNVYGGGKGKIKIKDDGSSELALSSNDDLNAGLVKGNTNVTINGGVILHNVYGGGAIGSVGTFDRDAKGMPTECADETGLATVTINGGTIGHDHEDTGMVDGSSRGWEGNPNGTGAFAFLNQLAWVNNTIVTVGDSTSSAEDKGPTIFGSVYGGGENGHNFENAVVAVNKGTVGYDKGTWDCGNIYGAGCGTDTFWRDDDGEGDVDEGESNHHNPMAGLVRGTTLITINGGNVLRNVYGGGSMGSVGTYTYDENGLPTTCTTGTGNTTININGGTIGKTGTDYGHVFGGPKGNLSENEFSASVRETQVNINTGTNVLGSVFGGGEAGIVKESVVVNMSGGEVMQDVYGGGALANTNVSNTETTPPSPLATTTVNLTGGRINRNVYGGALGQTADAESGKEDVEAKVYGDVLVELNNGVADDAKGCIVLGSVFGCNNLNGTPKGDVKVHIYKTQNDAATRITNPTEGEKTAKVKGRYDLTAVYGGGNLAAYEPKDLQGGQTNVIIDGCDATSIQTVYGGGNAASTPATSVTINGTFEIEEVFGGGNGKDRIVVNGVQRDNPGANVGFKDYSSVEATYDTKEKRTTDQTFLDTYVYGSGRASVNIFGGTIHRVFGGSNTKGNVRHTAVTMLEDQSGCEFCVDEAYGGGKSAPMDAEAQLLMACIPGLKAAYGGAEAADIQGDVTLNITNGTFERVFGGNNMSGAIRGVITVNIEETGCKPLIIGELYGGGNRAAYSVYGYRTETREVEVTEEDEEGNTVTRTVEEEVLVPVRSGDDDALATPYADPQVNVKSFTHIGTVYGGGLGAEALMVGSPHVNINQVKGKKYGSDEVFNERATTLGTIDGVFGGGNQADVEGDTYVNIGTESAIDFVTKDAYMNETVPRTGVTVEGANITGDVFGGGNNANVSGNTHVRIGKN